MEVLLPKRISSEILHFNSIRPGPWSTGDRPRRVSRKYQHELEPFRSNRRSFGQRSVAIGYTGNVAESEQYQKLSALDRETLRAFLRTPELKRLATDLHLSDAALEQRLKRIRAKLGVRKTIQAATLVARVENGLSSFPDSAETDVVAPAEPPHPTPAVSERGLPLPYRSARRRINDLPMSLRLIYPVIAAALVALAAGVLFNALALWSSLMTGAS